MIEAINLIKKDYPSASFIVTGHSLGAAISTFAALET
jgi:putative lipase involved disintegration of autophagic bodies